MASSSGSAQPHFVIGSRKSDLAMWQAREVKQALERIHPTWSFEIRTEFASGDHNLDQHLATLASVTPGVFTKELEAGLQSRVYDLAVHSLKDMPTSLPAGLVLACVTEREDPRDAVVLSQSHTHRIAEVTGSAARVPDPLGVLPSGSVVGTSSLRREAFLRRNYPELSISTIRGNLNTRLRKLDASSAEAELSLAAGSSSDGGAAAAAAPQRYDALVLAVAGMKRMGWSERVSAAMPLDLLPYAVGQGALGIECRGDDEATLSLVRALVHVPTFVVTAAERAFLNALQGGCQVPIGVHCYLDSPGGGPTAWEGPVGADARSVGAPSVPPSGSQGAAPSAATLTLSGNIIAVDGSRDVQAAASAPVALWPGGAGLSAAQLSDMHAAAAALGREVARRALKAGAGEILGPLTAARAPTYGAAEQPLDR